MNCLDRITIQMHIDNELPADRSAEVQMHLKKCATCKKALEDSSLSRSEVHALLSTLDEGENTISTTPFDPNIKRKSFRKRTPISFLWKVAAGIALLIGLFWIIQSRPPSMEHTLEQADLLLLELMGEVEPNKAWHNGQMGIIILDEKGDVLQLYISNDTD